MKRAVNILLLLSSALAATACNRLKPGRENQKDEPAAKPFDSRPIEAQKSANGVLNITTQIRSDGLLLRVANVPAGSTLECHMDSKPLLPCQDGAVFARPLPGDHKITAVALKDGQPVAFGESPQFTVLPTTGSNGDSNADEQNPLTLIMDQENFQNGMTWPMDQDFTAKFKLAMTPECKPTVRCKYDSRSSQFWTQCNSDDKSFTVDKNLLALGVQYLSVQASCGDQLGPVLTVYWYGVPADYKPLMLKDTKDSKGRHLVELIRDQDCAEGQTRKFECAAVGSTEFQACADSNSFENPKSGSRVRLNCGGSFGPELSF